MGTLVTAAPLIVSLFSQPVISIPPLLIPSASIPNPATVPFVLFWYCADKSSWLINKTESIPMSSNNAVDVTLIVSSVAPWLEETVNGKISPPKEFIKLNVSPDLKTVEPILFIGTALIDFWSLNVM